MYVSYCCSTIVALNWLLIVRSHVSCCGNSITNQTAKNRIDFFRARNKIREWQSNQGEHQGG
jgi:hypothetical protein